MGSPSEIPVHLLPRAVPRDVIDAEIRGVRYPRHDPARWALPLLDALEQMEPGTWMLAELDAEEYGALWLPAHAGEACHGDGTVLGAPGGGTVEAQAAWLERNAAAYALANPSCSGRITAAQRAAPTPLVVSRHTVGDRLKPDGAALVVVDGYHRALGYWRAGHRTVQAYVRHSTAGAHG